jgi:Ser/Thr protein kinase RdoA (MazF antagonist)
VAHLDVVSRRWIDPQIVERVARSFGIEARGLAFVRDVANIVYASADGTRFLRFSHHDEHSEKHVRAEIEWLDFLVAEGLPVCRPVRTKQDDAVLAADGEYTAAVFERVRGAEIAEDDDREPIFTAIGSFLGQLHNASSRFRPRDPNHVRPQWNEVEGLEPVLASWASDDHIVIDAWREIFGRIQAMDAGQDRFGLIHGDVHRGNISLHEEGIDVFDFDDSCYFFHAADVANSLYYALWFHRFDPEPERRRLARRLLDALLSGYRSERPFGSEDVARIPDLLEFRELTVDAFSHRRRLNSETDVRKRYQQVRARIASGALYVEF